MDLIWANILLPCRKHVSEKAMAPHSSTLVWKIPWMEKPGRLQSVGSLSQTRLSDFPFIFHFHGLEKEMATHFSVLAWRIPGMGEPGGLPSLGSHRIVHDWSNLAAAATHLTWTSSYSSVPCCILPLWLPNMFICLCVPQHLLIPVYIQGIVVDFMELICQHQYSAFC